MSDRTPLLAIQRTLLNGWRSCRRVWRQLERRARYRRIGWV